MVPSLFTDSQFFPEHISLPNYYENEHVEWLRPSEICKNPKLFSDKPLGDPFERRHEVIKGHNGGFFLAAVAGLTGYPDQFDTVVVPGQGFGEEYEGKFKSRFLEREGAEPVEVVIDDHLPTINGKLIFAQAPGDVFWCALLEKAYAKFLGDYNHLNLGEMSNSLLHLTGLSTVTFSSDSMLPSALFNQLSRVISRNEIICCKHKHDNGINLEYGTACTVTGIGIVGKDYQIRVRDVTKDAEETMMMIKFKEEFDVIVVTVEDGRAAEKRKKKHMSMLTTQFDEYGRNKAVAKSADTAKVLNYFKSASTNS